MADPAFLLDSNICIYLLKGLSPGLMERVAQQEAGSLAISSITLAEIGVAYGENIADAKDLQGFLSEVEVMAFDARAAEAYARLPFRRARFDRLIGAHALSLGLTLVTNNERDFADIEGLEVENWTLPL